jgi:hypothetical protein
MPPLKKLLHGLKVLHAIISFPHRHLVMTAALLEFRGPFIYSLHEHAHLEG